MTYNNYLGDVCEPGLDVIMKELEKAKFTNIPTINYFIVRTAESLCKGHLVDLGTVFSVPITHKLLVRLYQYMTYSNNAHRHTSLLSSLEVKVSFSATY